VKKSIPQSKANLLKNILIGYKPFSVQKAI